MESGPIKSSLNTRCMPFWFGAVRGGRPSFQELTATVIELQETVVAGVFTSGVDLYGKRAGGNIGIRKIK